MRGCKVMTGGFCSLMSFVSLCIYDFVVFLSYYILTFFLASSFAILNLRNYNQLVKVWWPVKRLFWIRKMFMGLCLFPVRGFPTHSVSSVLLGR